MFFPGKESHVKSSLVESYISHAAHMLLLLLEVNALFAETSHYDTYRGAVKKQPLHGQAGLITRIHATSPQMHRITTLFWSCLDSLLLKLIGFYPVVWLKYRRLKPLLCCIINFQLTMLKSHAQIAPVCPSPITRLILFIVESVESLQCQMFLDATPN